MRLRDRQVSWASNNIVSITFGSSDILGQIQRHVWSYLHL